MLMDTFIQQFECFSFYKTTLVYNEKLKKDIPSNWNEIQIKKLATIDSGYPFNSDNYISTGQYKLITIKNVQDSGIDI